MNRYHEYGHIQHLNIMRRMRKEQRKSQDMHRLQSRKVLQHHLPKVAPQKSQEGMQKRSC